MYTSANTITEASKYTDTLGNKELAADIQLNTSVVSHKSVLEDGGKNRYTIMNNCSVTCKEVA